MTVIVLVPAYNPDEALVVLIDALIAEGFQSIVLVDDGSAPAALPIFTRIRALPSCTVLTHAANLGKGRALKTGLNHIYLTYPDAAGIVTVDADGQHPPGDVAKVVAVFRGRPDALVLGARVFGRDTPLRSRVGNVVTRAVFRFLVGSRLSDTQSGLRCFARALVPQLLQLEGERYEYEMNMLLALHGSTRVVEAGISTVYLENNRSSHFNPLYDSMKIYFLLLRFFLSSTFTSVIDFLVFSLAFTLSGSILTSVVVGRFFSGNINFFVNRRLVFISADNIFVAVVKYYALLAVLGAVVYASITTLSAAGFNVIAAKILTETLLFLASFSIQRDFVFSKRRGETA